MHFLNPGYLWGLLALAVPLIVHLFNLQKSQQVIFSNTRMLENLIRQTSRAKSIRHLLLLLIRMLALACIIVAFAQPVLVNSAKESGNGLPAVIVYADNSVSMTLQENDGSAFDKAISFASSVPDRSGDKGWFRIQDNNPALSGRNWTSASGYRDQLLGLQKSPGSKTLQTILNQSYRQFNLHPDHEARHLYILSDFQKGFMQGVSEKNLDSSVVHHFVRFSHGDIPNIWIDSAWTGEQNPENLKITLFFRIRSSGLQQSKSCRIQLFEGSGLQAGISLEVRPGADLTGRLRIAANGAKCRLLRLEMEDPSYPADNTFFLVLKTPEPYRVTCLAGKQNPVLKKLFSSSPSFQYSESNFLNPDYSSMEESDLLILDKPAELSESLRERVLSHLNDGKSVCITPAPGSSGISVNGILPSGISALPEKEPGSEPEKILLPGPENSFFFSAFRDPGKNPVLPTADLRINLEGTGFPVLRFESGKPFVTKIQKGSGSLFLFSGDPGSTAFSFHRHPLMLAAFFRMAASARKENPSRLFEPRNENNIGFKPDSGFSGGESQVELRNGKRVLRTSIVNSGRNFSLGVAAADLEEGFWEVFQNTKKIDAFAVNRQAEESVTEFLPVQALKDAIPPRKWVQWEEISENDKPEHLKAGKNSGNSLWKYFLFAGIFLLSLEGFLLGKLPQIRKAA